MKNLALETIQPWAPHPLAAPLTERDDGRFIIRANGTRTCVGGWQMTFAGAKTEKAYPQNTAKPQKAEKDGTPPNHKRS